MPLAATVPNRTMPAPPSTDSGTAATTRPKDGQQAQHHQDHPTGGDNKAALDARDGHQAHVLGKGALGEGAKDGGDKAGGHVGAQSGGDALGVHLGVNNLPHGQDVGCGFRQDHQHHNQHGDDGGDVEGGQAKVERHGQLKNGAMPTLEKSALPMAIAATVPMIMASRIESREMVELPSLLSSNTTARVKRREHDVGDAAVVRGLPVAAHGPVGRNGHQRQADGGDDAAGHNGWEEPHDLRKQRGDEQAERRRDNDGAKDGLDAAAANNRHHGGHAGKGDPLHQRQLRAEERQPDGLQQRGQSAHEQCRRNQHADVRRGQAGGLANDERDGDDAAVHGQYVLESVGETCANSELFILGPGGNCGRGT